MSKPRLLDLFCGAGGASMGYHLAGFEVVGVDINPQPSYPFKFYRADALRFHLGGFDAIHASPPCQAFTALKSREHADVIDLVRDRLSLSGVPWVMENIPTSPLRQDLLLCGSMFGLDVRRHRIFESNFELIRLHCQHDKQTPRFRSLDRRMGNRLACVVTVHGHLNYRGEREIREKAMGIDWMSPDELSQAIPPAYTKYVGSMVRL